MPISTITIEVSGNQDPGNAQFTVDVDGTQVGDTFTVTADHSSGQLQAVTLTGDFGPTGPSTVDVNFLNDTVAEMYVHDVNVNGNDFLGSSATVTNQSPSAPSDPPNAVMFADGTAEFTVSGSPPSGGTTPPPNTFALADIPHQDFNGDGTSDLLVHGSDGSVSILEMSGGAVGSTAAVAGPGGVDASWYTPATGDFNNDGNADIIWRNDNGAVTIWEMNGATVINNTTLCGVGGVDKSWYIPATGDFDGNGTSDIVWRNDNGAVAIWEMNGTSIASNTTVCGVGGVDKSWHIAGTGDFNADNKADILWENNNGALVIWDMNGATIAQNVTVAAVGSLDPSWSVAGVGDFNGDGTSDILLRNGANGALVLWEMQNNAIASNATIMGVGHGPDSSWHVASIGDYDHDGQADIFWHNDNGQNMVWTMNGATVVSQQQLASTAPDWHVA